MASCLVTGGAGFIGSHIVDRLVSEGHSVRVLDNFSGGSQKNLEKNLDKLDIVNGNICDILSIKKAMIGIDYVFHEAAIVSVGESIKHPKETWKVNVECSRMILEEAHQAGVTTVVLASSAAVYGNAKPPLVEDVLSKPLSPYGESKLALENMAKDFQNMGLNAVSLRYFNVYGPRQSLNSESGVIARFVDMLCNGTTPTIYGDGTQTRDFIYVSDVAEANIQAIKKKNLNGQSFNIATGKQTSLNELVNTINSLLGTSIQPKYGDWRPGDIKFSYANIEKANAKLGFKADCSLERGLKETIKWRKSF